MLGRKIYSGSLKLATGTLGSRVLGFLREILAARFVGAGHEMDVFVLAYRIPNLVRQILGEKAAESAYLPVFKTLLAQGKEKDAHEVSADLFKSLILCLGLFVVIGLLLAPVFVSLVGRGYVGEIMPDGSGKYEAAVGMTRLLLPYIVFVGFFSFLGARLLAFERFGTYATAPLVANAIAVIVIVATAPVAGWYCVAWGALAAAASECLFFLVLTKDRHLLFQRPFFRIRWGNLHLRRAVRLWMPIVAGSGLEKTGSMIEIYMAAFLGKGAAAALYYANLLTLLAFSVLGLSFNRSVIPHLTEQGAKGNFTEFRKTVSAGIRLNLLLLLPAACLLFVLARPLLQLFFEGGRFDAEATGRVALTLQAYSIGLLAMGWVNLLSRSFYALLDTRTPLFVSAGALVLNVTLNFLLWKTPLRQAGLALAASISFWASAVALALLLQHRLKREGNPFVWRALAGEAWPSIAATAAFALVLVYAWPALSGVIGGPSIFGQASRLAATAAAAGAVFVGAGMVLGVEEIRHGARKFLPRGPA